MPSVTGSHRTAEGSRVPHWGPYGIQGQLQPPAPEGARPLWMALGGRVVSASSSASSPASLPNDAHRAQWADEYGVWAGLLVRPVRLSSLHIPAPLPVSRPHILVNGQVEGTAASLEASRPPPQAGPFLAQARPCHEGQVGIPPEDVNACLSL